MISKYKNVAFRRVSEVAEGKRYTFVIPETTTDYATLYRYDSRNGNLLEVDLVYSVDGFVCFQRMEHAMRTKPHIVNSKCKTLIPVHRYHRTHSIHHMGYARPPKGFRRKVARLQEPISDEV